ncbi:hypothetical protein N307_03487, partial [Dryobates pubescens]
GSLGLDLAAAVEVQLFDKKPVKVPTGVYGPVRINGKPVGCLLIGRSSASMSGLSVITGLIDADYTGEIYIMASTFFPPMVFPRGSKITQLIPLPQLTAGLQPLAEQVRGDGGFGSSTAPLMFLTAAMDRRPQVQVTVAYRGQQVNLHALLDTGADVSVIS